MGWETRARGGRYYTHSYREGGRVWRAYIGHGPRAARLVAVIEARRAIRAAREAARRREAAAAAADPLGDAVAAMDVAVGRAVRLALWRAGYHQHHRGAWRRSMDEQQQAPAGGETTQAASEQELSALIIRAEEGDKSALPALRALTGAAYPALLAAGGDLAVRAEWALCDAIAQGNAFLRAGLAARAEELRRALAGPVPDPLAGLLVERIVACWLHLYHEEWWYAKRHGRLTAAEEERCQRAIDRAQRRYLAALKALAQVRRLALPAVQVNIAEAGGKQVNVAG